MATQDEVRRLAQQVAAGLSPEQQQAFLAAVLHGGIGDFFGSALETPRPDVGEVPARTSGFRVRLDLLGVKPPVWRRLELPGDLTLDRLHLAVQAAMGWTDSHLHRFRTGNEPRAPYFVTSYDVEEEGEEGVLEDDVRLDQVVTRKGDRLWYDYDFGDGWEHRLSVEAVLDEPPAQARCTAGRLACPPEDCGGIWGYTELARWVRGGYDPTAVPDPFDDAEHARDWLPPDWHPDSFDVEETDAALAIELAPPVPVAAELAALRDQLERRGDRTLTAVLARPVPDFDLTAAEAVRLLEPIGVLLDVIGDGVRLTGAGYLPPAVVEQLAERTGITQWYIGKANREDLTWPVARLRQTAQGLGLVSVRKGVLAPTAVVRRHRDRPLDLWRHVVSRLPLGKNDFDRQAGWLSLAVVGSGTPPADWDLEIRILLLGLGWRVRGSEMLEHIPARNPTLDALEVLDGRTRLAARSGPDLAVAATARAAIAP